MKIDATAMAKMLGINIITFHSMIQNKIITRYELRPQKKPRYLFSEEDAAAAMIVYDMMSLGFSRNKAAEIGNGTQAHRIGTGIKIFIDTEKYRDTIRSKFKKLHKDLK